MQIATWNVNSLKIRSQQVIDFINSTKCSVIALQELKQETNKVILEPFIDLGYQNIINGQKTYNGVALFSLFPMTDVKYNLPNFLDDNKRVIAATINGIRVINIYAVNGEHISSNKYQYKLSWYQALYDYIKQNCILYKHIIVLGDFNIAPADNDIYDSQVWHEQVLCSTPERLAFKKLLSLGFTDSFRLFNQQSGQYTWWDYRNFSFKRKLGARIDHILISAELVSKVQNCYIDSAIRANDRPSDHAPIILQIS
jgi:exodeoxyribonuclease-3